MTKNKLEKKFSESLKKDECLWGMKLHNNPLAHQTTPADYIISHQFAYHSQLTLNLVECKQVTCKEGKGRLAFSRLNQIHDLLAFKKKFSAHNAYFCIAYYDINWANSDIYMVPVENMEVVIFNHNNVSLNRNDAKRILEEYKLSYIRGIGFDLNILH